MTTTWQPPKPERATIPGPVGPLEAVIETPADADGRRHAVVCHPHPLFGGTMTNKVVHTASRALNELGIPTIRFNFRGVGTSPGSYDNGVGETDDALAVADFAAARWPGSELWAVGFSFGSYVALQLALRRDAARLVTIAPPVQRFDFAKLAVPRCPWLVVQGTADDLVNHEAVQQWTGQLVPPPQVVLLDGVEHFFHGRLTDLKAAIQAFARAGAQGSR